MHVAYEERFADRTTAYKRVDLNSATYGGHPAVEWEFLHGTAEDCSGSTPCTGWWTRRVLRVRLRPGRAVDPHAPVYDAMVANSRP